MTEYITSAAGDRVAYDRRGTGPAVVFIAGAGPYRATDPVTTQTAELAAEQGVSTLVFDRLGRGESAAAGRLDLDRELEAISALLDVAGGHAVLVGHSSGCSIALAAAARGLEVDGLALWEAPLGGTDGGAQTWSDEIERRIDADDLEGALKHYMKDMPPEWLAGAKASPQYQQMVAQVVTYRADGQSLAWAESAPLAQLLAPVKIPVLAMYGTQTFPEMPRAAAAIAASAPNGTEKQMPGAQHSWEPGPMASELVEFTAATQQG